MDVHSCYALNSWSTKYNPRESGSSSIYLHGSLLVVFGIQNLFATHRTDAFFVGAALTVMRTWLVYRTFTNSASGELIFSIWIKPCFFRSQSFIFVQLPPTTLWAKAAQEEGSGAAKPSDPVLTGSRVPRAASQVWCPGSGTRSPVSPLRLGTARARRVRWVFAGGLGWISDRASCLTPQWKGESEKLSPSLFTAMRSCPDPGGFLLV